MLKFLAFRVVNRTYQFFQMPFGLSLAPRIFTKIIKVLAKTLAAKGIKVLMYSHGWLISAPSTVVIASSRYGTGGSRTVRFQGQLTEISSTTDSTIRLAGNVVAFPLYHLPPIGGQPMMHTIKGLPSKVCHDNYPKDYGETFQFLQLPGRRSPNGLHLPLSPELDHQPRVSYI